MKVNKDILLIYEGILSINKNIISELELVQLDSTNYSNLKHDNDGTHLDSVNKPLLDDLDAASRSAGIVTTITTAITGHPSLNNSGSTSRHLKKTAVDIALLNGIGAAGATNSTNGNSEFRVLGDKLKNALVSMGYSLNIESGNDKAVLWQTNTGGNHFNHLHVSNNTGESSGEPTSDTGLSQDTSNDAYDYALNQSPESKPVIPKYAAVVGDVKSVQKNMFEEIQEIIDLYESILSNNLVNEVSSSKQRSSTILRSINEKSNFGKNISNRYGSVIIPKEDNSKIKSPISGKITTRYSPNCVNPVLIENTDNDTIYLQYCGISSPSVRDGQSIDIGDVIGKTDTDVRVEMFDYKFSKIYIQDTDLKIDKKETNTNKKSVDDTTRKTTSEPQYYDPAMAAIFGLPAKILKDKFDKGGNRTEKRYGGVADKQEVDPFILNFLKDPFKRKKVNENIERIKKML